MNTKTNAIMVIAAIIAVLAALLPGPLFGLPDSINTGNAILALTAIIVLWYTSETSLLRKEMGKQTELLTRPIVVLELSKPDAFLKNYGKGPAVDVSISKYAVSILNKPISPANEIVFRIPPIPYLPQDDIRELKVFKDLPAKRAFGTRPQIEDLFQLGGQVQLVVNYRDIEGRAYQSRIEVQSGMHKSITFCKLRGDFA